MNSDFRLVRRYLGTYQALWLYVRRAYLRLQVQVGFELGCLLFSLLTFAVGFWLGGINRG